MNIPAVVLGATGYVGGELLRLIAAHPHFDLLAAVSGSRAGEPLGESFPQLASHYAGHRFRAADDWAGQAEPGSRLALFSAAPHGASATAIARALDAAGSRGIEARVADCSADFRYASAAEFESVYGIAHPQPALLPEFFCGVPEHVGGLPAGHAGHPGCFATAILLAAVPLVKSGLAGSSLFVSGVTGSTGSGRSPQPGTHHPERHNNLYAYKPLAHRHVPEAEALIRAAAGKPASVRFLPHSGPFARGIYVSLQAELAAGGSGDEVRAAFAASYEDCDFVRVVDGTPRLKDVVASNRCDLGIAVSDTGIAVMCAIDNLLKGAAGGAMQWMNRMWNLPEAAGLTAPSPAWV